MLRFPSSSEVEEEEEVCNYLCLPSGKSVDISFILVDLEHSPSVVPCRYDDSCLLPAFCEFNYHSSIALCSNSTRLAANGFRDDTDKALLLAWRRDGLSRRKCLRLSRDAPGPFEDHFPFSEHPTWNDLSRTHSHRTVGRGQDRNLPRTTISTICSLSTRRILLSFPPRALKNDF